MALCLTSQLDFHDQCPRSGSMTVRKKSRWYLGAKSSSAGQKHVKSSDCVTLPGCFFRKKASKDLQLNPRHFGCFLSTSSKIMFRNFNQLKLTYQKKCQMVTGHNRSVPTVRSEFPRTPWPWPSSGLVESTAAIWVSWDLTKWSNCWVKNLNTSGCSFLTCNYACEIVNCIFGCYIEKHVITDKTTTKSLC